MSTTWIEPPPQRKRTGCFGKGCLTFIGLILFFAVAFIAGTYFALRHYYLSSTPAPLPKVEMNEPESSSNPEAPAPPPEQRAIAAKQQMNEFSRAAHNDQAAHLEYSTSDINALIQRNRKSNGTAVVVVEGNRVRVETSIPLSRFDLWWQHALGLSDKYLNSHFTISSPANGDLSSLQIDDLVVNNHAVSGDALDFTVLGRTPRNYLEKYAQKYHVSRLEIADGKVILESGE